MFDLSIIYILGVVFLISLVLNKVLTQYSHILKLVDKPNGRSMHRVEKSRAGGIAIFSAFSFGILISDISINIYIIFSFLVVFLLGLYDDRFSSSSKTKILCIIIATFFLVLGDTYISNLGVFLGKEIGLPSWLAIIFTTFALVGFVNAVNLIDGIDGLCAGVSIVILIAYSYLGFKYNDQFLFYIASFLIVSLLGFLWFNWNPSKIFMGDSGSLTLGFVIAVLSIHSVEKDYITPTTVLLLTAVPILDTLVVMLRRIRNGQNPFKADKTHIHHIILKQHYQNVSKTSKLLILLQAVFTYIGLGFKVRDDLIILTIFIMLFILFYALLTPKKNKLKKC